MSGGKVTADKKEAQVITQLNILENGLDHLTLGINKLEDDIGSVLLDTESEVSGTGDERTLVPLANRIRTDSKIAHNLVDKINSIIDRLEL